MVWVKYDTVADVTGDAGAGNARRNEVELVNFVADDQRVSGIVPALKTHDAAGAVSQPVNDLAFAFVAPLGANDHYIFCHVIPHRPLLEQSICQPARPVAGRNAILRNRVHPATVR